jgi:hypothetical protein
MSKQSGKSHETSALVAGIAAFTTWGLVPIYWKAAQGGSSHGDSCSPFYLDVDLLDRLAHLAAPLDRSGNQCSIAAREILLSGKRLDDRDHLVFIHLGGEHRARHRDESRLFHDAAHECFAWRSFRVRATHALAIRFCCARNDTRSSNIARGISLGTA